MYVSSRQLLRENAELRRQLGEWEHLRDLSLQPFLDRTGNLDLVELLDGLARLASLALRHGVPHQQLLDAVKPDPRGVSSDRHQLQARP